MTWSFMVIEKVSVPGNKLALTEQFQMQKYALT